MKLEYLPNGEVDRRKGRAHGLLWAEALADELDKANAELGLLRQHRDGHLPDCAGMNLQTQECACGYLQGEAYRDMMRRLDVAERTVAMRQR